MHVQKFSIQKATRDKPLNFRLLRFKGQKIVKNCQNILYRHAGVTYVADLCLLITHHTVILPPRSPAPCSSLDLPKLEDR